MTYTKLLITLFISFLLMYGIMFLNMEAMAHYHTSTTRIYMALLMVAPMAIIMILMMGKMYPNRKKNLVIMVTSAISFFIILIALRTQTPISDVQYMKAMIPHHSSAIMVSKNANLKDPEVIQLSKEIIKAQEKEIAEMEALINKLSR